MKKRRILIVVSIFISLPVMLIIATTLWMTEGSMPTNDEIITMSDKLLDDSMLILKKYPEGAFLLNANEYPESIKALSPLSLWSDSEGLYILTQKQFVQGWGIFIPREDSEKYLERSTMPSYNMIVKGIYKFYSD